MRNAPSEEDCISNFMMLRTLFKCSHKITIMKSSHMFPFFISQHCCNNSTCKKNPNWAYTNASFLVVFFCFMCTHACNNPYNIIVDPITKFQKQRTIISKRKLKIRIKEPPIPTISKPSQNQTALGERTHKEPTIILFYFS